MIKKIFLGLIFLCAVSAGVLFMLIRSSDSPPKFETVGEDHAKTEEHAKTEAHGADPHASADAKAAAAPAPVETHMAEGSSHEPAEIRVPPTEKVSFLVIVTEPVKALVYSGDEKLGETPFKMPLDENKKKLRLVAEGFEVFEKDSPAKFDAGQDDEINWKIQLRAKKGALLASPRTHPMKTLPVPVAPHSNPVPVAKAAPAPAETHAAPQATPVSEPVVTPLATGSEDPPKTGNFHLQLEAMPFETEAQKHEADAKLGDTRKRVGPGFKILGCTVDLGAKGTWMRIIAGPYEKKDSAKKALIKIKKRGFESAFVTGKQTCLR